jgi:hypothetical protein
MAHSHGRVRLTVKMTDDLLRRAQERVERSKVQIE